MRGAETTKGTSSLAERASALAVLVCLVGGCATTLSVDERSGLAMITGTWQGWIVTSRDFVAATLLIRRDGTFELSGRRTIVPRTATGRVSVQDGLLRFEGSAGWRGRMTLQQRARTRLLVTERDDRLFPGRFTPVPAPLSRPSSRAG
jgi:hypothetical protein